MTTATPAKRITLNPQDKTNVMRAVAFHVNGHAIPKQHGDLKLYDRVHGEDFLTQFFLLNTDVINNLGQRPDFAFWRTIHDDLFGKELTLLLINGLMVKGFIGVNGYEGETFDINAGKMPKPVAYVNMLREDGSELVEEVPFLSVIAVNARLPLAEVPVIEYSVYEEAKVPLIDDTVRNQRIIDKHREEGAKRHEKRIYTAQRRVKNNAERKARRKNRK